MLSQLTSLLGLAPAKSIPEARKDAHPETDFARVFADAEDDAQTFQPDPALLTDADEVDPADPVHDPDTGTEWVDDLDHARGGPEKSKDGESVGEWLDPEPEGDSDAKGLARLVDGQPADPTEPKDSWLQHAEELLPNRGPLDGPSDLGRDAENLPDLGPVTARDWRKADNPIDGTSSDGVFPKAEMDRSPVSDLMRGVPGAGAQPPEQHPALQGIETVIKPAGAAAREVAPDAPVPPTMSQGGARSDVADRLPANPGSASPLTGNAATKPATASAPGLPDIPVFRFGLSQPAQEQAWPRMFEPPVSQSDPVSVPPGHAVRTGSAFGLAALSPEDRVAGTLQAREKPASPLPVDWSEGAAQDRSYRIVSEQGAAGPRGSVSGAEPVNVQPKSATGMVDPRGVLERLNTDLSLVAKPDRGTSGTRTQADPTATLQVTKGLRVPREAAPTNRAETSTLTPDVSRPMATPGGVTGPAEGGHAAADGRGPERAIRHAGSSLNGEAVVPPEQRGADPATRREPSVMKVENAPPATRTEPAAQSLATSVPEGLKRDHLRHDPEATPRPDRVFSDSVIRLRPDVQGGAAGKADALAAAPGGATPALAGLPLPGTSARVTSPFLDDLAEDLLPLDSQAMGAGPGTHSSPAQVAAMPQAMQRADVAAILRQVSDGMARLGEGSVEIRLSPEELGQVRMQMVPSDGGMTVHITADRPETLDLMRRHIDLLARDLADAGYESASFSFGEGGEGGEDPAPRHERAEPMPKDDVPATVARNTEVNSDGLDLRF